MRNENVFYYHSFDEHNDHEWWNADSCIAAQINRKQGHGGFTLFIDPALKVIGISICSAKDRFSRPEGRLVAQALAEGAIEVLGDSDREGWLVAHPYIPSHSSDFVKTMVRFARIAVHDILNAEDPDMDLVTFWGGG